MLVDFSDEDEDVFPLISSPKPLPRRPGGPDDDCDFRPAEGAGEHEQLLHNLVQPAFEEDEDDVEDHEFVPSYSSPLRSRAATRMKGLDLSAKVSSASKPKRRKRRKRKVGASGATDSTLSGAAVLDGSLSVSATAVATGSTATPQCAVDIGEAAVIALAPPQAVDSDDDDDEDDEDDDETDDDGDEEGEDEDEDEDDAAGLDDSADVSSEWSLLRSLYDQCMVVYPNKGRVGADRISLANGLRFGLSLGGLADEILALQTPSISWSVLKSLAELNQQRDLAPDTVTVLSKPMPAPAAASSSLDIAATEHVGGGRDDSRRERFSPVGLTLTIPPASSPAFTKPATPRAATPPREPSPYSTPRSKLPAPTIDVGTAPAAVIVAASAGIAVDVEADAPSSGSPTARKQDIFLDSLKKALSDSAERTTSALARAEEVKQSVKSAEVGGAAGGGDRVPPPKPQKPAREAKPLMATAKEKAVAKIASRARRDDAARELISPEISEHFKPPPLSEFAEHTGVIIEGWLEKQSMSGLWQRRWFVLAESKTEFCVLRIYGDSIKTAWGDVGVHLKATIPVVTLERIQPRTAFDSSASEREFLLVAGDCSHFHQNDLVRPAPPQPPLPPASQSAGVAESRELILRAEGGASRMMWTYMLRQARAAALEAYE